MKEQIKEKLNQAIEIILEHEGYYIDILNIDDVLVKNLRVYADASYFDIPLKVEVTKYDLV